MKPYNTHGEWGELTSASSLLTSTHALWYVYITPMALSHTEKKINKIELKSTKIKIISEMTTDFILRKTNNLRKEE